MPDLVRVRAVEPLTVPFIRVVFTTGEVREIDLTPYLAAGPIFDPVRTDPALFAAVTVEGGTVAWPNGADIDPDVLFHGGTPTWALPASPTSDESTPPTSAAPARD